MLGVNNNLQNAVFIPLREPFSVELYPGWVLQASRSWAGLLTATRLRAKNRSVGQHSQRYFVHSRGCQRTPKLTFMLAQGCLLSTKMTLLFRHFQLFFDYVNHNELLAVQLFFKIFSLIVLIFLFIHFIESLVTFTL